MRNLIAVLLAATPLLAQTPAPPQAPAAPAPPIPRYEVKRASSPITVDGKLDEPAWAKASEPLTLQFFWESQTGAKQKTLAKLLWDDQALYLGFDADDADITGQLTERDAAVYRDDALEIFINPNPRQEVLYYGFEMNVRGALYDYLNYNERTFFKRYDATNVKIATTVRGTLNVRTDTDEGWSLEASIPWQNFEELSRRPAVGATWRANINRWDGVEPARRMSEWSDPVQRTAWPHGAARFGELVFVE
jgi:hypothetical protein